MLIKWLKIIRAFVFGDYEISMDNKLAIYASNTTGSWADYTIRVKDLSDR